MTSMTRPVETEQPVIYIAGPMTGHEDFNRPAFFEAEAYLRSLGYEEIYNPAIAQHTLSYKTLIDLGLKALKGCNVIFMLHGWYQSRGARLEHLYALTVGLTVIYQDEIEEDEDGDADMSDDGH